MYKPKLPTKGTRCFKLESEDGVVVEANEAQRLALAMIAAAERQEKVRPGSVYGGVSVGRATQVELRRDGGARFDISAGARNSLVRARLVERNGTALTARGREAVQRWDDDVDAVCALVPLLRQGGGA